MSIPASIQLLDQWKIITLKYKQQKTKFDIPHINNDPFTITSVTLTGRQLKLNIRPLDTVLDIKKEIYKQDGLPLDQQQIVFNGVRLHDDKMIYDCGIEENARIHLILRLRGGMFHATSSRADFKELKYDIEYNNQLQKALEIVQSMQNIYGHLELLDSLRSQIVECRKSELQELVDILNTYYISI